MIKSMSEIKRSAIMNVADLMATAALTAPKASGHDTIRVAIVTGEEKDNLRDKMIKLGETFGQENFKRDAGNVDRSECVVLIACTGRFFGMANCSLCGYEGCRENRNAGGKCAITLTDLGVAVGSAASIAADNRVDNRIMYTAGKAAIKLGYLPDDAEICYGIPLAAEPKNIFFDRGPGSVIKLSED